MNTDEQTYKAFFDRSVARLTCRVSQIAGGRMAISDMEDIIADCYYRVFKKSERLRDEETAERLLHRYAGALTADWLGKNLPALSIDDVSAAVDSSCKRSRDF